MIELRWVVPPHTTTQLVPELQYREIGYVFSSVFGGSVRIEYEWITVPRVVVPNATPKEGGDAR